MLRDPGTLWHTVVGERMLQSGDVVTTDDFSFTKFGEPWIAQQWLGECAMALVHRIAGLDGLLLLAVTILAAMFAGLGGRLIRAGLPWPLATVLLLLVAGASSYHFIPRPHLVTIALMAGMYGLLCDVSAGRRPSRSLLTLPLLFIVWTNIHGGVLGAIGTTALVLGPAIVLPRRFAPYGKACPVLFGAVLCLSFAAVLVNPYGPELPSVWLGLLGSDVLPKLIVEHAPLRAGSIEGVMILSLTCVYIVVLVKAWHRGPRITWLVPLVWLVMAFSRVRHGPLFAVTAAIALADMLPCSGLIERLGGRSSLSQRSPRRPRFELLRGMALPCGLVAVALLLQSSGMRCPLVGSSWARLDDEVWPVEAAEVLRAQLDAGSCNGRVFNDMLYGGYLIYHVSAARVFIDDRCELYGDWGLTQYAAIHRRPALLDGPAIRDGIAYALVRTGSRTDRYLNRTTAWEPLHHDPTASLYHRRAAEAPGDGRTRAPHPFKTHF